MIFKQTNAFRKELNFRDFNWPAGIGKFVRLSRAWKLMPLIGLLLLAGTIPALGKSMTAKHYPGLYWDEKVPNSVDVKIAAGQLQKFIDYIYKSNKQTAIFVSRFGYKIALGNTYSDDEKRDVASACKGTFTHFFFKKIEEGKIHLDDKVADCIGIANPTICAMAKKLLTLNPDWGINSSEKKYKDKYITWRHLANQTSCYGVADFEDSGDPHPYEAPGSHFCYSDYQIALFWDLLFQGVYEATVANVDIKVLDPFFKTQLKCEDSPSYQSLPNIGRLNISARDFARFGLLYMYGGEWANQEQLIPEKWVNEAATWKLDKNFPRSNYHNHIYIKTGDCEWEETVDLDDCHPDDPEIVPDVNVIDCKRSLGGANLNARDQTNHKGSYGWLWWKNGVDQRGKRFLPDAPIGTFACLGHGGEDAMIVIPEMDIVVAWQNAFPDYPYTHAENDNDIDLTGCDPNDFTVTEALKKLMAAIIKAAPDKPKLVSPADNETVCMLTPTLKWDPIEFASPAVDYFQVQIKNIADGTSSTINVYDTSYTPTLKCGTRYAWFVRAHNEVNFSNWSGRTLNVVTIPAKPVLTSPAENETVCTLTPIFKWGAVIACPVIDYYQLQINYNGAKIFATKEGEITSTSYTLRAADKLEKGKRYAWYVRVHNAVGWSTWSGRNLTVGNVPDKPTLVSPENNATVDTTTPTFTWNTKLLMGCPIDYYELQINNADGSKRNFFSNLPGPSYTLSVANKLESGKTYAWFVRAHNGVDFSNWSGRIIKIK